MARVLVVEDDSVIRELVKATLLSGGYEVSEASSVPSAFLLMETEQQFDLIIVDLMLGQRSGWEVLDRLDQRALREKTRLMVLSALSSERNITEGWERGVDHYLPKPFSVEALLDAVEYVLNASPVELAEARRAELHKSKLLDAVENVFPGLGPRPAGGSASSP